MVHVKLREEELLYKLKSPNVHSLKICHFSCNVDISSPAQTHFFASRHPLQIKNLMSIFTALQMSSHVTTTQHHT